MAPSPPRSGEPRVLVERYQIIRQLGAGGMGVVFLAHDTITKRAVVAKVLRTDLPAGNDDSAARLRREAERLASVRHPNVVEFFDFGVEGGNPFIVMEYIVGRRLDEFISEMGVLQTEVFVPIASQILKAVGYAHSLGVVLRDIKPENIMVCRRSGKDLFVKVLDFGLARMVGGDGRDRVTRDQLVGTPACISPEEIQGKELDGRADVYALGVLFYRMLTGANPFRADSTAALLYKHINEEPPPFASHGPAHISPPLEALVIRCLAKSPELRPVDANAVMEVLIDAVPTALFRLPPAGTYPALNPLSRTGSLTSGLTDAHEEAESTFDSQMTSRVASREQPKRPRLLLAGVVATLLLAGASSYFVLTRPDPSERPRVARSEDTLAEVESLLRAGEPDAAERLLDKATASNTDAAFLARAEVLRTKVQVERGIRRARGLELSGDVAMAIDAYLAVLEDDPENDAAAEAVRRLRVGKRGAEGSGVVNISSQPRATLFVDGQSLGRTPVEARLSTGPHNLELLLDGRTVWNEQVEIGPEGLSRSVVMPQPPDGTVPVVSPKPNRQPTRQRQKPRASEDSASEAPASAEAAEPTGFERVDAPAAEFKKIERQDGGFGKLDRRQNNGSKLRPM